MRGLTLVVLACVCFLTKTSAEELTNQQAIKIIEDALYEEVRQVLKDGVKEVLKDEVKKEKAEAQERAAKDMLEQMVSEDKPEDGSGRKKKDEEEAQERAAKDMLEQMTKDARKEPKEAVKKDEYGVNLENFMAALAKEYQPEIMENYRRNKSKDEPEEAVKDAETEEKDETEAQERAAKEMLEEMKKDEPKEPEEAVKDASEVETEEKKDEPVEKSDDEPEETVKDTSKVEKDEAEAQERAAKDMLEQMMKDELKRELKGAVKYAIEEMTEKAKDPATESLPHRCPKSHPFPFAGGKYCCESNKEGVSPKPTCNKGTLTSASTCCDDNKFVERTKHLCPRSHPYAFAGGKYCCESNKEGLSYKPTCNKGTLELASTCCDYNKYVALPRSTTQTKGKRCQENINKETCKKIAAAKGKEVSDSWWPWTKPLGCYYHVEGGKLTEVVWTDTTRGSHGDCTAERQCVCKNY